MMERFGAGSRGFMCWREMIRKNGNCLDTGFMSVGYLLEVLSRSGKKRLAYELLFQEKCPSWLYEVENGATTLWESWLAVMPDGSCRKISLNHYAFGCVGSWMYEHILGIRPLQPGYRRFLVAPEPEERLFFAEGSFQSVYGRIEVSWKTENGKMRISVKVPMDTEARIRLPRTVEAEVKRFEGKPGISRIRQKGSDVEVDVGAGNYSFEYAVRDGLLHSEGGSTDNEGIGGSCRCFL